ncbi:hypothetical protein IFR05_010850 [Cadophora sp. M221]|nr:hypothetical protein IFR05_010850 [Cadophora sp. M221]
MAASRRFRTDTMTTLPPLKIQRRLAQAHSQVTQLLSICGTPGIAYSIIHHGQLLFTNACGYGDVEKQLPPNSDTKFLIRSISTTFLSAAVGLAVREDRVNLHAPLSQYLPTFSPLGGDPQVCDATIRQVLSHTNGLGSPQILINGPRETALQGEVDFVNFTNEILTGNKSGSRFGRWTYSNLGYGLIALALQNGTIYLWTQAQVEKETGEAVVEEEMMHLLEIRAKIWTILTDRNAKQCFGPPQLGRSHDFPSTTSSSLDDHDPHSRSPLMGPRITAMVLSYGLGTSSDADKSAGRFELQLLLSGPSSYPGLSRRRASSSHSDTSNQRRHERLNGCDIHLPKYTDRDLCLWKCCVGRDAADWTAKILAQSLWVPNSCHVNVDFLAMAKREAQARRDQYQKMLREWESGRQTESQSNVCLLDYVGVCVYEGLATTLEISTLCAAGVQASEDARQQSGLVELQLVFNDVLESAQRLEWYCNDVLSFFPRTRDQWLGQMMVNWDFVDSGY